MTTIVQQYQYVEQYYTKYTLLDPYEDIRSTISQWLTRIEKDVVHLALDIFSNYLGTLTTRPEQQLSLHHIYTAWSMMLPETSAQYLSEEGIILYGRNPTLHCHLYTLFHHLTEMQKIWLKKHYPDLYNHYILLATLDLAFGADLPTTQVLQEIDVFEIEKNTEESD